MKNLSHFPKADIRFWQRAVFRQPYVVNGQRRLTKEWYARLQFQGKRAFFPLGTPSRAAAAAKARGIFLFLTVNGWPLTLVKYKPRSQSAPPADTSEITVGSFLTRCSASARTGPRSKGTQLRSGKSSPTSSGWPLTRQNSITNPAAGTNGWQRSIVWN